MVAVMNTLAIYEQFRTVLGEERAKSFAETIGTMIEDAKNTATKEDFRILRESADANTARLEAALARLTESQARTEAKLEQLIEIVTKLVIRSDRHEGDLLELKFRDRLPSYLGRLLRKAKVIEAAELIDAIEPTAGAVAVDDFLRSDVVATGTLDGSSVYLVGEISYTAEEDDVMRAARRTACLVKAGLPAVGLVACEKISPQTAEYASKEGVRVWLDAACSMPRVRGDHPRRDRRGWNLLLASTRRSFQGERERVRALGGKPRRGGRSVAVGEVRGRNGLERVDARRIRLRL